MKKKTWLSLCITFILCVAAASIYVTSQSEHTIQAVNMVEYQAPYLYGVDYTEESFVVFRINVETMEESYILIDRVNDTNEIIMIQDFVVNQDNQVYLLKRTYENQGSVKITLDLCDFDKNYVDEKWDLSQFANSKGIPYNLTFSEEGIYVDSWLQYPITYEMSYLRWLVNEEGVEIISRSQGSDVVYSMFLPNEEATMFVDRLGNIYEVDQAQTLKEVFMNDGSQVGIQNLFHQMIDGNLHFYNCDEDENYVYELDTQSLRRCDTCLNLDVLGKEKEDVRNLHRDGQAWVGTFSLDDYRSIPWIWHDDQLKSFNTISQSETKIAKDILILALCLFAAAAAFFLFYKIYMHLHHQIFSTAMKMICFIIPCIVCSYFVLENRISNDLKKDMLENKYSNLYQIGSLVIDTLDKEALKALSVTQVDAENFNKLIISLQADTINAEAIKSVDSNDWFASYDEPSVLLTKYKDGEFYDVRDDYYMNVPLRYLSSPKARQAMEEAVAENAPTSVIYNNNLGVWNAVFIPIYDSGNKIIGMLEINSDIQVNLNEIMAQVANINRLIIMLVSFLGFVLVLMVMIALRPLNHLLAAVEELAEGKLGIQVNSKGSSEVAQISKVFNRMSLNISQHMNELDDYKTKYSKFVPQKVFELLNKKDVRSVRLGDEVGTDSIIMTMNTSKFQQIVRNLDAKSMFAYINRVLQMQIPLIQENNGLVIRFVDAGTISLFTENPEDALRAAITFLQQCPIEEKAYFSIGLCHGFSKLGIIGHESRMSTVTVSPYNALSRQLQKIAPEYGCKLLMTNKVSQLIADFDARYHTRSIGYIYLSAEDSMEKLIEVYDGDDSEQYELKEKTILLFEQGVKYYVLKEYKKARNCFVEVLNINREDKAAQKYFYLCDYALNHEQEEITAWIETY